MLLLEAGPDYPEFEHLPDELKFGSNNGGSELDSPVQLEVPGPGQRPAVAAHEHRAGQGDRRLRVGERPGVPAGAARGLRLMGRAGQHRVELRQCPAVLPQAGDGHGRARRFPRHRRSHPGAAGTETGLAAGLRGVPPVDSGRGVPLRPRHEQPGDHRDGRGAHEQPRQHTHERGAVLPEPGAPPAEPDGARRCAGAAGGIRNSW